MLLLSTAETQPQPVSGVHVVGPATAAAVVCLERTVCLAAIMGLAHLSFFSTTVSSTPNASTSCNRAIAQWVTTSNDHAQLTTV
jgi:hypothetical protein